MHKCAVGFRKTHDTGAKTHAETHERHAVKRKKRSGRPRPYRGKSGTPETARTDAQDRADRSAETARTDAQDRADRNAETARTDAQDRADRSAADGPDRCAGPGGSKRGGRPRMAPEDRRQTVSIRLAPDTMRTLRRRAERDRTTMTAAIEALIRETEI